MRWHAVSNAERAPPTTPRGARTAVAGRYFDEFVGTVRLEPQLPVEPAAESRVHRQEVVDFLLVAGADEAEVEAVRLESDQ